MWLPGDRYAALAWQQWEREHCPGCGEPKVESFDPANEWMYEGKTIACHSCAAKFRAQEKVDTRGGIFTFAVKKVLRR